MKKHLKKTEAEPLILKLAERRIDEYLKYREETAKILHLYKKIVRSCEELREESKTEYDRRALRILLIRLESAFYEYTEVPE